MQAEPLDAAPALVIEEVRAELEAEYATSEREHLFGEKFNDLVDESFASPGSLEPTAKALEMPVQKTELFDRKALDADKRTLLRRAVLVQDSPELQPTARFKRR